MPFSERAHAAIQTRRAKLDHRLRVGEATPHLIASLGASSIELLVKSDSRFGDYVDALLQPFCSDVEVAAHVSHRAVEHVLNRTTENGTRDLLKSCRKRSLH